MAESSYPWDLFLLADPSREMIQGYISGAVVLGAREVWIGTGNSSISQLALYQKMGFRIAGVDVDFFTRNYPEEIIENGIHCRDMIRLVYGVRP